MTRIMLAVLFVLLVGPPGFAQTTWFVDDDNCPGPGSGSAGDPYCSIQLAIIVAAIGDEIIVAPGTYNESINFFSKGVTVRSTNPNDPVVVMNTVIDGTGHTHVIQCVNGEGPDTVLTGLVITGGNANINSFPENCGGGMIINGSSPTVTNCSFIGNSALNRGGCIYNYNNSSPMFTNCLFQGNFSDAGGGGAVYNDSSSPTFTNCRFSENTSLNSGGAMHNVYSSHTVVTGCTFCGNHSWNYGGGLYNDIDSIPTVTNCSFEGNSATSAGGAMANFAGAVPIVANTGFSSNAPDTLFGPYTDNGGNSLLFCPPPIPLPDPCPADTNGDGVVNVTDLLNLLAAWGACPPG